MPERRSYSGQEKEDLIFELLLSLADDVDAMKADIERLKSQDRLDARKPAAAIAPDVAADVVEDSVPGQDTLDDEAESEAPAAADIAVADVAANDEGAEWNRFIEAWQAKFGPAAVTVSDLIDLAGELPLGDGNDRSRKTKLGLLLAAHHDQPFQGCWLQMATMLNGSQRWHLEPVEQVDLSAENVH